MMNQQKGTLSWLLGGSRKATLIVLYVLIVMLNKFLNLGLDDATMNKILIAVVTGVGATAFEDAAGKFKNGGTNDAPK